MNLSHSINTMDSFLERKIYSLNKKLPFYTGFRYQNKNKNASYIDILLAIPNSKNLWFTSLIE